MNASYPKDTRTAHSTDKGLATLKSKTFISALLAIVAIAVAVTIATDRSDSNEAYFAQIKDALISTGTPIVDAEAYEAKSGLSSYLIVSAIVDDTVQVVEASLLKNVLAAIAQEIQEKPAPIVISIRHVDSAALDTEAASKALGLPDNTNSISGRITLTPKELTQLVQRWR